jgi:hypothetical protein
MKNKQVIDSWNKIEPDSDADARMLDAILARNQSVNQSKKKEAFTMSKIFTLNRLAPIAACLVVVIAITAIFGNNAGWFGGKVYAVELDGGTLNFYKSGAVGSGNLDFGVETNGRELTAEENGLLFGSMEATSYGLFNATDHTLLHVEGRAGNAKIILAAHGVPVADTVIETNRKTSEVNGIPVSAGYWITDKNSNGEQNIIFLASYEQDGVNVYAESAGRLGDGEEDKVMAEIANVINTLTKNGMSYLPGVYFDTNIENQKALYIAGNSWVSLVEGNKYYLCGPAAVSFTPSGTYTIDGDVLTLYDGNEEAFKFIMNGDTLIFESGEWLENWIEPGTIFMLAEPE